MNYSPLLSIVTAVVEIAAGVWTLRGPGRKPILRTTAAILFFLAGYQIVEAILCTGNFTAPPAVLPRLGFIVVAWLPPTGLLLLARLYPIRSRLLHAYAILMYVYCVLLVGWIVFEQDFVSETVCLVVFARYTNPTALYNFYGLFYQVGLMSMLFISAYGLSISPDEKQRLLLGQLLLGCLAFIVPSLMVVAAIPIAEAALPSILCHFALMLALFLIRLVAIERRSPVQARA